MSANQQNEGRVLECWLHRSKGADPERQGSLTVDTSGVEGHRHQDGTVVLIQAAAVEAAGLQGRHRRNVVTTELPPPPALLEFESGLVLQAFEFCEPCQRLAKRIGADSPPRELVHTGLRARVVQPGSITDGASFRWR